MNKADIEEKIIRAQMSLARSATTYGAFQRAKVYSKSVSGDKFQNKRNHFRKCLFDKLEKEISIFTSIDKDEDYYSYLVEYQNSVNSSIHTELLQNGHFRLGNTQKLVNLYWKMLWLIVPGTPEPIHCPFDRIIIRKLDGVNDITWTDFDDIEVYKKLVRAANVKASEAGISIAQWELKVYPS